MSDLPIQPRTKQDYREALNVCRRWTETLEEPEPFDEWEDQLAREMDRRAVERGGGRR